MILRGHSPDSSSTVVVVTSFGEERAEAPLAGFSGVALVVVDAASVVTGFGAGVTSSGVRVAVSGTGVTSSGDFSRLVDAAEVDLSK